jgi:hypothetical protein
MTADWCVTFPRAFPCPYPINNRYNFPPEVLRRISSRITNEVNGVNRVTYDISSKPPGVSERVSAFFLASSFVADD